jgi:uncharacterized protein (TIGR03437 family)
MKLTAAALLFSLPAFSQAVLNAGNAASGSPNIAPGSLVAVVESLVASGDLDPLHARMKLQSIPLTILPTSSALAIYAMLPENAPLGPASLILSHDGRADLSFAVNVVPASPGLFSAQNLSSTGAPSPNALSNSAIPGQYMTLWATGIGNSTLANVSVEIGGTIVAPIYAAHAAGSPGMDQINFRIPAGVSTGCYVALTIRAQGIMSNQIAVAVSTAPGACHHPLGLSPSEMLTLDQGGSITFGSIALARNVADPELLSLGFVSYEGATATFGSWNKQSLSGLTPAQIPDEQLYTCQIPAVPLEYFVPDGSTATGDAGPALAMMGPGNARLDLTKIDADFLVPSGGGQYTGTSDQELRPGLWALNAPGGKVIGTFQQPFTLPRLHWINRDAFSTFKRSAGATIYWDARGFQPSDVMTVRLSNTSYPDLSCRARATAGRLELPPALLKQLSPSAKSVLSLSAAPNPVNRFLFRMPLTTGGTAPAVLDYLLTDTRLVNLQ